MSSLTLNDVSVRRGEREVLRSVSARFEPGRLTVVIGPNGAGKSTLLEVAAGLLQPERGEVLLGDDPLDSLARRMLARRRAYLPQVPRVEWPITVERVVALGLTPNLPAFGGLPERFRERIDRALAEQDLTELRERPATRLSGGELARAMLARATVGEPELLIVDEPTAGLDPRHGLDAVRRLRALADGGCTVVVAIHDLDLAARVADDVLAIKDGQVRAHGPLRDVLTQEVLSDLYDVSVRITQGPGLVIRFF